jgi:hypothetical protein
MKTIDLSDLKVGDKAWSAMHGEVAITALDKNSEYPIVICLNSLDCFGFTLYGRGYKKDIHPTLFHSKQEAIEYWGMESNHLTKRELKIIDKMVERAIDLITKLNEKQ